MSASNFCISQLLFFNIMHTQQNNHCFINKSKKKNNPNKNKLSNTRKQSMFCQPQAIVTIKTTSYNTLYR